MVLDMMIDIHTHILPYIDDGAKDIAEALKMTECLKQQLVHMAICTPHFNPTKNSIEDFVKKRKKALEAMYDSKITLISGSETLYHEMLYQYSDLDHICIHNTKYLLLELPYKEHWRDSDLDCINKLINLFNIIPIIAHIERYKILWKKKKNIRQLMRLGCLMQVNAGTIIDKRQRKIALAYIKNGLIDLIGSDCHNMSQRPPNIKDAFVIIEKDIGILYSDLLKNNANSIIKGLLIRNNTG